MVKRVNYNISNILPPRVNESGEIFRADTTASSRVSSPLGNPFISQGEFRCSGLWRTGKTDPDQIMSAGLASLDASVNELVARGICDQKGASRIASAVIAEMRAQLERCP